MVTGPDATAADGNQGDAAGDREKTEDLGVVVAVGSEVETLAAEEEGEEGEAVVVTELRDPWLERRELYMAATCLVDVVREYLARMDDKGPGKSK